MIYDLIDDVKAAMEGKLRTVEEKVALGTVGAAAAPMCCCCKCGLSRGVVHDGCPLAPGGEGAAALRGACPPPPPHPGVLLQQAHLDKRLHGV